MKYLSIETINRSLKRIHEGGITHEHRTGTAANGLINHYFDYKKFTTTPEQIQPVSRKKPDFSIELLENGDFVPHVFVEIKSLINSNFEAAIDQVYDTVIHSLDSSAPGLSTFVIIMKGTKIAFFQFYSFVGLLEEYGISHYKGFIPLNQLIETSKLVAINDSEGISDIMDYVGKYAHITTNKDKLLALGVEATSKITHPHIWELLNESHEDHVHDLFVHAANNKPGLDIK